MIQDLTGVGGGNGGCEGKKPGGSDWQRREQNGGRVGMGGGRNGGRRAGETKQGRARDEGTKGGRERGGRPWRHHRTMAVLRCPNDRIWSGRSPLSSSSSSIRCVSQAVVARSASWKICSAWGRAADHHQTGDGKSWTHPPPPPFPAAAAAAPLPFPAAPLAPSPRPVGDGGESRTQTSSPLPLPLPLPPPSVHLEQSWSWSWNHQYALLLAERASGRSRSASGAWPSEKMNSKKDVTLPISTPPAVGVPKDDQRFKPSRMTREGGMVALAYMGCAVMLVMFNKSALSSYKFPCANIITVLQMVCSTAFLYVLRKLDVITFASDGNGILEPAVKGFVPFRILKRASPLSISYLFYMVVGMASIRGVNVPMYTTLRRTTVLLTMVLEFLLAGQRHSTPIVSSVGLIVIGAFIAGARDLSFDGHGYLLVLVSNLTTAMYLTTISRLGKSTGLNSFGLMWCNGIICGPILLLWTVISGELGMALQFPAVFLPGFQLVILLSCMLAFCLNYTIFLNTSLNSPLTQTMCGNIKDLGTVLLGWIWFGGLPFDWFNVLGQFLGFLGSGLYAYCKLKGI